jgi:hypothetical protein
MWTAYVDCLGKQPRKELTAALLSAASLPSGSLFFIRQAVFYHQQKTYKHNKSSLKLKSINILSTETPDPR